MKSPVRRIDSFLVLVADLFGRSAVSGARHVELRAACGHAFVVQLYPDQAGGLAVPIKHACALCPLVPNARENDFVEGGPIARLSVAR